MIEKFDKAVNYLTKKGINEKLVIDKVSFSCGAGPLAVESAEKTMKLEIYLTV